MKMQLLRWNNAEPTPRPDTRPASSIMATGAGCRGENPRLRRREKNVLDIPFYRAGVSAENPRFCVGSPVVHLVMCGARLQFEQKIFVEVIVFRHADVVASECADRRLGFPERDDQNAVSPSI